MSLLAALGPKAYSTPMQLEPCLIVRVTSLRTRWRGHRHARPMSMTMLTSRTTLMWPWEWGCRRGYLIGC